MSTDREADSPTLPSEDYRRALLEPLPRVLGRVDREALGPTFGCCDRTFWAWKFVDFPRARFQEAACYLAFLWRTPFAGNELCGDARLLAWTKAVLGYWTTLQHPDGSFDEAYPNERSLAATAFTSFYVSEAVLLLGDELAGRLRSDVLQALGRAAGWLCKNDESHGVLSNHLAAAAAACAHVSRLVRVARFQDRAEHFVDRILERQSSEGWYEEYGGADPGYQTHGSFYLARLAELGGGERLARSLERATDFLVHCVHPDHSLGGEYASRNTKTWYPAACEMLAARSESAAWLAAELRPAVASASAAGLRSVDSYNLFPQLNNVVFAYRAALAREADGPPPVPADPRPEGLSWFPDAGLAVVRRPRYAAWLGVAKGGTLHVYDRAAARLVHADSGWVGELAGGRLASSQALVRGRAAELSERAGEDEIALSARFFAYQRPTMSPWRSLAFRAFSLTAGRSPRLAAWLKRLLVRVLIDRRADLDLRLARRVVFDDDGVSVRDELSGADGARLSSLRREATFTTIHMGSARYWVPAESAPSAAVPLGDEDASATVDPAHLIAGARRAYRVPVGEGA